MVLFELCLIVGLLAVACNPSPFYAALGLVCSAGVGCLILVWEGASFLSLVLFLVYLGGMMVVFAYSAALVTEPYPEAWGNLESFKYLIGYLGLLGLWWKICGGKEKLGVLWGTEVLGKDWLGVSVMFSYGGGFLLMGGWGLLLTLFVVLEVVRGHYSGVLRAV